MFVDDPSNPTQEFPSHASSTNGHDAGRDRRDPRLIRPLRVIVVTWLLAGLGAAIGGGLGELFGRKTTFLGAMVGATLAILYAVRLLVARHWFNAERRRGGTIGGLCGLALAAPLASMNLDAPGIVLLVAALTGVGVVVGAGGKT